MKIDRLNGYTLVARTNFPILSYVFLCLTIACGVGFLSVHDIEPKSFCGLVALIFALLTALITKRSEVVFDSRKNEVKVSMGSLIMNIMPPIAFADVKAVKIERSTLGGKPFGRIVLVLKDRTVPLSPSMQPVGPELEKNAKQLIRFVGLSEPLSSYDLTKQMSRKVAGRSNTSGEFNFDDLDNEVVELVRKKRLIDAIKLHRIQTGLGLKESKDVIDEIQRRIKNGSM